MGRESSIGHVGGGEGVFIFKGSITVAADFPTLAQVKNGWTYIIIASVTDNDPTKTNTGQSFVADDVVAWNGTNWTDITGLELIPGGVNQDIQFNNLGIFGGSVDFKWNDALKQLILNGSANIGNLDILTNVIQALNVNGGIELKPNGIGEVKVATNLEVVDIIKSSISSVVNITAVGGIIVTKQTMIVQSSTAGNVDITANPQINIGTAGQHLYLIGNDDVKTVTLANGNGLKLDGSVSFKMRNKSAIHFISDGVNWIEISRSSN